MMITRFKFAVCVITPTGIKYITSLKYNNANWKSGCKAKIMPYVVAQKVCDGLNVNGVQAFIAKIPYNMTKNLCNI